MPAFFSEWTWFYWLIVLFYDIGLKNKNKNVLTYISATQVLLAKFLFHWVYAIQRISSSSSSSSCRAAIHDPLSPLLPVIHRLW